MKAADVILLPLPESESSRRDFASESNSRAFAAFPKVNAADVILLPWPETQSSRRDFVALAILLPLPDNESSRGDFAAFARQ